MKCPYCGGEVPSQSISCPFCGRENPEGIAFQEEVRKKIERNKLLKPFLIKQKTPELVQKMLTRIWVILIALNGVLLLFSFFVFLWTERGHGRKPADGSHAERVVTQFDSTGNWEYDNFCDKMYDILDAVENGEEIGEYDVEWVVEYAYDAVSHNTEGEHANSEECLMTVDAFFRGYLGFSEEDMVFLMPNEEGEYELWLEDSVKETAIQLVWEKLEVAGQ